MKGFYLIDAVQWLIKLLISNDRHNIKVGGERTEAVLAAGGGCCTFDSSFLMFNVSLWVTLFLSLGRPHDMRLMWLFLNWIFVSPTLTPWTRPGTDLSLMLQSWGQCRAGQPALLFATFQVVILPQGHSIQFTAKQSSIAIIFQSYLGRKKTSLTTS